MFVLFADTEIVATANTIEEIEYAEWKRSELDEYNSYKSDMYRSPRYEIAQDTDAHPYHTLPCWQHGDCCPFSWFALNQEFETAQVIVEFSAIPDVELPF